MKTRDYYKYELKEGNKVVYVGITKDPDRRHAEHSRGKDYTHMNVIGIASSKEGAENWESMRLKTYARNHGGQLPTLNKTRNGK